MVRRWHGPLVVAALMMGARAVGAQQLPDGPGKEIVEKQCSTCHSVEVIPAQRHEAAEWKRLVQEMIDRGAEVTDDEVPVVLEYLNANWGKPAAPAPEKPAGQASPVAPVKSH